MMTSSPGLTKPKIDEYSPSTPPLTTQISLIGSIYPKVDL